ncbi:hypothetical protein G7054_g4761 [Neopestalotiopsis clavispora]|nr:hypothetical protein E8E14_013750 [Neopestalotiopsis sp. 37M]KAF7536149.1 hypothetical protein G7054_g4761 [Neopestalotiopsis clavispora]
MSAFLQSLLSSAFPNVNPPGAAPPKGSSRPATTFRASAANPFRAAAVADADATTAATFPFEQEAVSPAAFESDVSAPGIVANNTAVAILVATICLWFVWYLTRRNSRNAKIKAAAQDAARAQLEDDATRKVLQQMVDERTAAFEKQFQQTLDERRLAEHREDPDFVAVEATLGERIKSLEESFQKTLDERLEAMEEAVRRRVNQRVEAMETRIKLDQEAIESLHHAINQRMEILEEGVRILDGKQLDQEATHITSRALSVRLEAAESTIQALDNKTRATSQRLEAMDDSSRVVDSRTKSLSQRVEAVEDNLNAAEGQVTLLSHDANRGVDAIEKLQKHIRTLPGNERLREFNTAWEERFKELERRMEQNQLAIEEAQEEPEQTLSWSHIEAQSIEPLGDLYTRPPYEQEHSFNHSPTQSFDGSLPPTPSSSSRSYSFSSSTPGSSGLPIMTPTNSKKARRPVVPVVQNEGFTDTTFSSRQKLFAARRHSRSISRQHSLA